MKFCNNFPFVSINIFRQSPHPGSLTSPAPRKCSGFPRFFFHCITEFSPCPFYNILSLMPERSFVLPLLFYPTGWLKSESKESPDHNLCHFNLITVHLQRNCLLKGNLCCFFAVSSVSSLPSRYCSASCNFIGIGAAAPIQG